MPAPDENLSPRQERVLGALLTAPSIAQAAETARLNERTVRRYLSVPEFHAAYMVARREALSQATAQLQNAAGEAVACLRDVMGDEDAPASARVAAAARTLEFCYRAVETEELVQRIAELERSMLHER